MTIGFLFFVILSILFLVILPYFGYYYSEKNIVIFLVPFILSVFYSVRKYFFSNILFGFGKLVVFGWSLFLSIVLLYIIKHYYISLGLTLTNFWGINQGFGIFDFSLGVVMFIAFYKLLERELLSNPFSLELVQNFEGLKRKLIYINSFEALNNILQKELCFLLKIKYTYINTGLSNQQDLVDFFEQDISNSMFINDIVFIQENKHKTQLETVRKNISEDIYIVLPLYENKTIIGFFELGKKSFADHYSSEEIDIIRDFVLALERHIKYIKTYNIINDLSFNLDKKVDEKTIEYNNLLNKQKEFIAILSHEIKGPVANAILQLECLLDDLKDCDIPKSNIISELDIVNQQFLKVGELTKNLFSVQSYDINKIELFKEKVNIKDFIITEFEVFESLYPDICFKLEMEGKLEYIDLDRVQMKQVIDNLLNNAVKFTTANDAQIHVLLVAKGKNIYLEIEDNGIGFKEVDISQIFEKYTTKGGSSVGLGMGLYLCKRIVEMHSGQITASRSLDLGGAKFQIKLPM